MPKNKSKKRSKNGRGGIKNINPNSLPPTPPPATTVILDNKDSTLLGNLQEGSNVQVRERGSEGRLERSDS